MESRPRKGHAQTANGSCEESTINSRRLSIIFFANFVFRITIFAKGEITEGASGKGTKRLRSAASRIKRRDKAGGKGLKLTSRKRTLVDSAAMQKFSHGCNLLGWKLFFQSVQSMLDRMERLGFLCAGRGIIVPEARAAHTYERFTTRRSNVWRRFWTIAGNP